MTEVAREWGNHGYPTKLECTMQNNYWGFLGWRSVHTHLCTPWARKCFLGYLGWVCLQCAMQKKILGVSAVALSTHTPLHNMGQKMYFWIPGLGVFPMGNAKKHWGVLRWRSVHTHLCTPWARRGVLGYLGLVCLQCAMQKKYWGFLGWRSVHTYLCPLFVCRWSASARSPSASMARGPTTASSAQARGSATMAGSGVPARSVVAPASASTGDTGLFARSAAALPSASTGDNGLTVGSALAVTSARTAGTIARSAGGPASVSTAGAGTIA